jgi:hypothetical protein
MKTFDEFCEQFTMTAVHQLVLDRPNMVSWLVTLTKGRQSMTVDYSYGVGHLPKVPQWWRSTVRSYQQCMIQHGWTGSGAQRLRAPEPKLADVVESLLSDAGVLDYATFEEWAGEFGFDVDSRKAERTYRQCLEIALQLRAMCDIDRGRELCSE